MENPKLFRKPPFADGISNDFPWKIAWKIAMTFGHEPWNLVTTMTVGMDMFILPEL